MLTRRDGIYQGGEINKERTCGKRYDIASKSVTTDDLIRMKLGSDQCTHTMLLIGFLLYSNPVGRMESDAMR